jgi:hypothetical protein
VTLSKTHQVASPKKFDQSKLLEGGYRPFSGRNGIDADLRGQIRDKLNSPAQTAG